MTDHRDKTEDRSGFLADIARGDLRSARLELRKNARLFEDILIGRNYRDVLLIAQRICGNCSAAHGLAAIAAIEAAMGIAVSKETERFRRLIGCAQIIQSHARHFFRLISDRPGASGGSGSMAENSENAAKAMRIIRYGSGIMKAVGGRSIHPSADGIGGFRKIPKKADLERILRDSEVMLSEAVSLGESLNLADLPDFRRESEHVSLSRRGEYAVCAGDIVSDRGLMIPAADFRNGSPRIEVRFGASDRHGCVFGANARVRNNRDKLRRTADRYLSNFGSGLSYANPFHNVIFQMAELIHFVEESKRIIAELLNSDIGNALARDVAIREGSGASAVEAPQGTLCWHIGIDQNGYVRDARIVTPNDRLLPKMITDAKSFVSRFSAADSEKRREAAWSVIRAYDPCVSWLIG